MVGRRKAMRERWPTTEEKALDLSHDEGIETGSRRWGPFCDMFMTIRPSLSRKLIAEIARLRMESQIMSHCCSWARENRSGWSKKDLGICS